MAGFGFDINAFDQQAMAQMQPGIQQKYAIEATNANANMYNAGTNRITGVANAGLTTAQTREVKPNAAMARALQQSEIDQRADSIKTSTLNRQLLPGQVAANVGYTQARTGRENETTYVLGADRRANNAGYVRGGPDYGLYAKDTPLPENVTASGAIAHPGVDNPTSNLFSPAPMATQSMIQPAYRPLALTGNAPPPQINTTIDVGGAPAAGNRGVVPPISLDSSSSVLRRPSSLFSLGDDIGSSSSPRYDDSGRLKFARGTARVPGKGAPTKDTVNAKLAPGEAVLNSAAAEMMGRHNIAALNAHGARAMGMPPATGKGNKHASGTSGDRAADRAAQGSYTLPTGAGMYVRPGMTEAEVDQRMFSAPRGEVGDAMARAAGGVMFLNGMGQLSRGAP